MELDAPLRNEKDIPNENEDDHNRDEYEGHIFQISTKRCQSPALVQQDQTDSEDATSNLFFHALNSSAVEKAVKFADSDPSAQPDIHPTEQTS